ncbi:uncharacterized protein L969DRAFT_16135 [Mixia osmundae IAM 14324]|uniref:Mechanosensitive ion channel protein n=1 Tax=Mixia osmundae (strain CBS 9802 / IAM 14324 / JCM 22182 / KY 12970) TaxID=764103 RepID=G7E5G7_MIXOS|nr:uncharacterized protein L969DRAFT_16135 [Mixia osmundae IAM 14324]KEI40772.1 hypothetical protein L969DRAFT_16135 [Mixia osmundae IAM 14324]GAA98077.1 hypothetical protein E5Q_04759 [Mixia osmundae IAM 14324]
MSTGEMLESYYAPSSSNFQPPPRQSSTTSLPQGARPAASTSTPPVTPPTISVSHSGMGTRRFSNETSTSGSTAVHGTPAKAQYAYQPQPNFASFYTPDAEQRGRSRERKNEDSILMEQLSPPSSSGAHAHFGSQLGYIKDHESEKQPSRAESRASYRQNAESKAYGYRTPPPLSRANTNVDPAMPGGAALYSTLANGSTNQLEFAEGDFGSSPRSRQCFQFLSRHIIVRWTIFILPVLCLLWIPGIIGLTAAKDATVWGVPLVWWSSWLSIVWVGWWGGVAFATLLPVVLRMTIAVVAPETRMYIDYLCALPRSIAIFVWALLNWILFQVFVTSHQSHSATHILHQFTQALSGIFIASILLLIEKIIVQAIAHAFHKKSYEDRLSSQKFQIAALTVLYVNSHDIGRSDTLDGAFAKTQKDSARRVLKRAAQHVKAIAQTSATVLGTVASEVAGERVLQPNSPLSRVTSALASRNKTRQLARRIYFSFVPSKRHALFQSDIERYFSSPEDAANAFYTFDRDGNGDVSLEELEMACLELHRERLSLASSMRDLDSAVARVDSILMTLWYIVSILIIVGLLDVSFNTMIASAGTLILGLSWLIGTTAQEILASIIFLLIKHPYDVGDVVRIGDDKLVVKEMHLLSTIFKKLDGTISQMPHTLLNTKAVENIRRSGPISETFTFDVDVGTSFESIEALTEKMSNWVESERRDYLPGINVQIKDFDAQTKLTLAADIKYRSNWQNGALHAQRRNKWICALKISLNELRIFGPAGDPDAAADPTLIKLLSNEPSPTYDSGSVSSSGKEKAPMSPLGQTRSNESNASKATLGDIRTLNFNQRDVAARDPLSDIFDGADGRAPLESDTEARGLSPRGTQHPGLTARDFAVQQSKSV